jgi:hypothetical protein
MIESAAPNHFGKEIRELSQDCLYPLVTCLFQLSKFYREGFFREVGNLPGP